MASENLQNKKLNEIFGITESYMLPNRLMSILFSDEKERVFDNLLTIFEDMSYDWFTDYFQEQHSNRAAMMQDFTPRELTGLLPELSGDYESVLDVCSGTGGLSIAALNKHNCFITCVELSERALPLLLLNLSIRNTNGLVINKNVLTGERKTAYRLIKGDKYSTIIQDVHCTERPGYDLVIMNPPYSLKYEVKEKPDYIGEYEEPPTKAADYAFILYGLHWMAPEGMLNAILPHGVLFRGQKEAIIRKQLILNKLFYAIIGLPNKLFLNTDIPVCIISIHKDSDGIFFVDASKGFLKESKQNKLRTEDCMAINKAFRARITKEKFARWVDHNELEANDYNLNISRYVDSHEAEELRNIDALVDDLITIDEEIEEIEGKLSKAIRELICKNDSDKKALSRLAKKFKKEETREYEQLRLDI